MAAKIVEWVHNGHLEPLRKAILLQSVEIYIYICSSINRKVFIAFQKVSILAVSLFEPPQFANPLTLSIPHSLTPDLRLTTEDNRSQLVNVATISENVAMLLLWLSDETQN